MKISKLKDKIITTFAIIIIIAIMYISRVPCLFVKFFGFQCPGCGMTRAYISLLNLNIKQAFMFHPMFWSVPILFAMYLFDGKIFNAKWANTILAVLIFTGFFIVWFFRLLTS